MKSKMTIQDIASELGLSPATVSRALNDHPRISKQTIDAVKKTATRLNYTQNRAAVALRKGRSKMLGVIIPTTNRNFFGSILRGIENVASERGYAVLITQSNDDQQNEMRNIEMLLQANVEAIFMSIGRRSFGREHLDAVLKTKTPLVQFDRVRDDVDCSSVVIDDYEISYQATEHLISQGCRRIAHFTGPDHLGIYRERKRGYVDAFKANGLNPVDELVFESDHLTLPEGRRHMETILKRNISIDGVFSASDFSAVGAMQVCRENGIAVPQDIAFVGFANESFTELFDPPLSTIDQKPEQMGAMSAQLFFEQMDNPDKFFARKTVLKSSLIIRQSSLKHTADETDR